MFFLTPKYLKQGRLYITTAARLAEDVGKKGAAIEGPPIKLTMTPSRKPSEPTYRELTRDALAVLQPGFLGTTAPDWLLRQVSEGLTAVGLFGRNIAAPDQLASLTAQLRAEL